MISYFTGFQDPAELDLDLLSPVIRSWFGMQTKPKSVQGIVNPGLEMEDEKTRMEKAEKAASQSPA